MSMDVHEPIATKENDADVGALPSRQTTELQRRRRTFGQFELSSVEDVGEPQFD